MSDPVPRDPPGSLLGSSLFGFVRRFVLVAAAVVVAAWLVAVVLWLAFSLLDW